MSNAAIDIEALKARLKTTWSSGDFGRVGVTLQVVGESLAEATGVNAGERVLDVAAGNGNASLAAARRFARVTSTDYVPELLEQGRRRAEADGLDIEFLVADAESLPFADDSFDVVLSTFGVMFAPDQARTAGELVRVVRALSPHIGARAVIEGRPVTVWSARVGDDGAFEPLEVQPDGGRRMSVEAWRRGLR